MSALHTRWALLLLLAATAAAYAPGLNSDFLFDDYPNIVLNRFLVQVENLSLPGLRQVMWSSDAGPLGRPISMLSFWANFWSTGLEPIAFKVTNIVIHLFCGIALFVFSRLLMRAYSLKRDGVDPPERHVNLVALTAAALWLFHPLNLTSVLYIVQRMTSLSALFMMAAACAYLAARLRVLRGHPSHPGHFAAIVIWGLLAVFSKENGALLPVLLLAIEGTLLQFSAVNLRSSFRLKVLFAATVGAPLLAGLVYTVFFSDWLTGGYANREFTLTERLLTECRVLWLYLQWALLPVPTDLGLFHDDIATSRSLLAPWTTLPGVAGIGLVVLAAPLIARQAPWLSFAIVWFLVSHSMESSVIALELVHEHRNYVPLMGLAVATAVGLHSLPRNWPAWAGTAATLVWAMALALLTFMRSASWSTPASIALAEARHHPGSSRAAYAAGTALLLQTMARGDRSTSSYYAIEHHLRRSLALKAESVAAYLSLVMLAQHYGQAAPPELIRSLADRLRTHHSDTASILFELGSVLGRSPTPAISTRQFMALFEAAMQNPLTQDWQRSRLFLALARYWYQVAGDRQQAVRLTMAAVEYAPDYSEAHVQLAKLAVQLGNSELAHSEIARVRSLDRLGRHAYELQRLEAHLKNDE